MKELMTEFNKRYNEMNEALQTAKDSHGPFSDPVRLKFIDYFNLCAEEWIFWKLGYIYPPIWEAWENGMRSYGKDPRVKALWEEERKTNSYYGFEFPDEPEEKPAERSGKNES